MLLNDRQRTNRVRVIAFMRIVVILIQRNGFLITCRRVIRPSGVAMDVTQMSNLVCQAEPVVVIATDAYRFFALSACFFPMVHVHFDVPKHSKCFGQVSMRADLPQERDRLDHVPVRLGALALSPRAPTSLQQLDGRIPHAIFGH